MRLCKGCGRIQFKAGATCYNCNSTDIVDTRTYAVGGEAPPPEVEETSPLADVSDAPKADDDMSDLIMESAPEPEPEPAPVAAAEDDMSDFIIESAPEPEPEPEPVVYEPEPAPVAEADDMSDFIMESAPEPEPEPVVYEPEPVVYEPEPAPVAEAEDDMSDFIMESAPEPEPEPVVYEPEPEPVSDIEQALAEVELASDENAEEERIKEEQRKKELEERNKEEALKEEENRRKEELRKKLEERKKEKEQEHDLSVPSSGGEMPSVSASAVKVEEPKKYEPDEDEDDEPKKGKSKKPAPPKIIVKSGADPRISKLTGNPSVDYLEMTIRHARDTIFLAGAAIYCLFSMAMTFIRVANPNNQPIHTVVYIILLVAALTFAVGFLFMAGNMKGKIAPRKNTPGLSLIKRAALINIAGWVGHVIIHFFNENANITFEVIFAIVVAVPGILVCVVAARLIDSLKIIITTGKYVEHIAFVLPFMVFLASALEIAGSVMSLSGDLIGSALGIVRAIGAGLMGLVLMKFCSEYKKSIEE